MDNHTATVLVNVLEMIAALASGNYNQEEIIRGCGDMHAIIKAGMKK